MLKIILIIIILSLMYVINFSWIAPLLQLTLFFTCSIYAFIFSPLIYWKLIIPQIEKRHGRKLAFNWVHRFDAHPAINKALDLAKYITYAYFGYRLKGRYYGTLDNFNYDVKTASKLEIFISISTTVAWYFLLLFLLNGFILIFHDWIVRMR